jgi:exodeoxyribonuclease VII large subunit
MTPKSVSQLVFSIKETLEGHYSNILCVGEISNLSSSASGHYYFNLSDSNSSISCALFKMDAYRNPIIRTIKNGDKIIVSGPISLYAKRGTFQILVKKIVKSGKGTLLEQYNQLKQKLANEGMFDLDIKKEIPKFAKKIVVITAQNSAALADFSNVFQRRALMGEVIIIPSLVQGEKSEQSLINAFKRAQAILDVDLIVFTRGGGSMEDLWSFNSELLARMIYAADIPVISAIGHQVDYTICDYVSDYRVETPTAAAEKITEKQIELKERIFYSKKSLDSTMNQRLSYYKNKLYEFSPFQNINRINNVLQTYERRLSQLNLTTNSHRYLQLESKSYELDELLARMRTSISSKITDNSHQINSLDRQLKSLDPKNVLSRGYSILRENDQVISSKKTFDKKTTNDLNIEFHDGIVKLQKR